MQKVFKPKMVDVKMVNPYIKKDGELSKRGLTDEEYERCLNTSNYEPFMRRKLQDFNLGSRRQIGAYLQDFGWKPKKLTPTGHPIVDEKVLNKIDDIPEAKLIGEYLLIQKRIAQIESWVKGVKDDGRIHGFVIPNGAITGRMTHRNPNVAQTPSVRTPYGKECRECWVVPKGYKLVGIDASGLEIRMLAHYMKSEDFTNEIIEGDIHARNQKLAGLKSRDQSKTFLYSLIYGAGDTKLGKVVGGNEADGRKLREAFFTNQPEFKRLRDRVTQASTKGFLKGIDGRKVIIRKNHSSLNTLLQSAGAVVMKRALIILNNKAKEDNIDYKFVAS